MNMRKNIQLITVLLVSVLISPGSGWSAEGDKAAAEPREPELQIEKISLEEPAEEAAEPQGKKPGFRYPPVLSPAGGENIKVQWDDKEKIGTITGRFYLSQKQDEKGGLLELQADNAVIFLSGEQSDPNEGKSGTEDRPAGMQAIYMSGNIVMTKGQRTIRRRDIL